MMSASITAYSTAVGPSSETRKRCTFKARFFMASSNSRHVASQPHHAANLRAEPGQNNVRWGRLATPACRHLAFIPAKLKGLPRPKVCGALRALVNDRSRSRCWHPFDSPATATTFVVVALGLCVPTLRPVCHFEDARRQAHLANVLRAAVGEAFAVRTGCEAIHREAAVIRSQRLLPET